MKLLIDDARIEKIRELYDIYAPDGVTTNPTILSRCGRPPYEVLREIREFIGPDAMLHVQVVSTKAEDMVAEAAKITEVLGKNTYIKIPTVPEGLKAMKLLKKEGYNVTATIVYSVMQAYLAAKAGADFVAPYINHIDNLGIGGVNAARTIQNIFDNNGFNTQILAASFRNSMQVQELCEYGIGACTVAPEIIEGFLKTPSVGGMLDSFTANFEKLCGEGKTMLDE